MKVDSELWWDVNVVASVLKLFLRKLPRCLLTPGMSVMSRVAPWFIFILTLFKLVLSICAMLFLFSHFHLVLFW